MTKHEAFDGSRFAHDLSKIEDMLDYLECYLMYPESNPINKKDIQKMCRRICNLADHIKMKTMEAGYAYFEEKVPEGYNALY